MSVPYPSKRYSVFTFSMYYLFLLLLRFRGRHSVQSEIFIIRMLRFFCIYRYASFKVKLYAERCNYVLSNEASHHGPGKKFTNTHSPPTSVVAHSNSQISLPHSMEPMQNRLPLQPCSKSLCSSQAAAPNKQEAQSVPEHP